MDQNKKESWCRAGILRGLAFRDCRGPTCLWGANRVLGNPAGLSRDHAVDENPVKPQRREGHSAAKPQPSLLMCVATTSIAKMEDREWRMAVTRSEEHTP